MTHIVIMDAGIGVLHQPFEYMIFLVLHQFHCDFSLSLGKSGFSKIPF